MINLLLGAPGGGKSYEAVVFHILPALAKGRKVITNLPLVVQAFTDIDQAYVELIDVRTESLAPGTTGSRDEARPWRTFEHELDYGNTWRRADGTGPLYVIDECHMVLPKGRTRIQTEEWYSMHRHENSDVLLITQSYGKMSAAIRDLVQVVYRVRKNVALGSMRSYTRKVQDGMRGEVVNTAMRKYEKRYFHLYKSHTKGRSAEEMGASDIVPIWRHWSVICAALCLVIVVGVLSSGRVHMPWVVQPVSAAKPGVVNSVFVVSDAGRYSSSAASAVVGVPGVLVAAVAASAPASAVPVDPEPFAGKGVHLVGWAQFGAREVWSLVISQNGQPVSNLTSDDLRRAGYAWQATGPCTGVITWHSVSRAVTCDLPQVSIIRT